MIVSEANVSDRRVPASWPVMLSAVVLIAVTTVVGLKLDADSASIHPDRYERSLEGTRSNSPANLRLVVVGAGDQPII